MRKLITASAVLGLALAGTSAGAADLKTGDEAPAFSLPGSDGKTYSLKDYKGTQVVVLAWFPKAFTGG
jgi:peroxiredoxin Q/BCP